MFFYCTENQFIKKKLYEVPVMFCLVRARLRSPEVQSLAMSQLDIQTNSCSFVLLRRVYGFSKSC